MNKQFSYNELMESLNSRGIDLITKEDEYVNSKQYVIVTNGKYKASVIAYNYITTERKKEPSWFYVKNPFIIYNINKLLQQNYGNNFECISSQNDCIDRDTLLKIRCNRCGEIINKSIHNMRKNGIGRNIISCPNCDGHNESIHAIVLKQMFLHYYPDTIVEDPSCINPNTGYTLPTDIVNHRLKIAIEIQGQYHNKEEQKIRDKIKKDYWINNKYIFYDYSIDNISVLEYVQLFFPEIEEIPDWITMDYNKKLNLKQIQNMLNSGSKVLDIAKELNINAHRIYDALHINKLYYPKLYSKSNKIKVEMLDINKNFIREYDSYAEAERDNNLTKGSISDSICHKRYWIKDHYFIPKDIFNDNLVIINT